MRKFYLATSMALLAGVCFAAPNETGSGIDERKATIQKALSKLDTSEDTDWTEAGLPDLGRMQKLTGLNDLKRAEVGTAVPGFHRSNAKAAPEDLSTVGASDAAKNAGPTTNAQKDDEAEPSELDKANEYRSPNLDPSDNPNVGDTDLGPYEGQTHTADQGEYLAEQLAAEDMEPTAIAGKYKDPIALIEAAMVAMNADERYRKNGELQQFMRHYSIAQVNIKSHQARLDKRFEQATT